MNNKGQVLVSFVIILPILLLLCGGLIEYSIIAYNKEKANSVTKSVIRDNITEKNEEVIKDLMKANGINNEVNVIASGDLEIAYTLNIESFLGKIINKDSYEINIDIIGHQDGSKIEFKKGEYYD